MQLTLFVPELLWPEPDDHPALADAATPALNALLARGCLTSAPSQTTEAALCALFCHKPSTSVSALRRLDEFDEFNEWGDENLSNDIQRELCADPVHLKFHDERLILADSTQCRITPDEAAQLIAALNKELSETGRFRAASTEHWYFLPANALSLLEALPVSAVTGRHVGQILPDILIDRQWRQTLNAIQTVLHAHPINQHRAANGMMSINSLWLWGDGDAPRPQARTFATVWSDLSLVRGLARHAEADSVARPHDATLLQLAGTDDADHLVVLDDLAAPVRYDDGEAWQQALASLEAHWFAPLRAQLAAGKLDRLSILSPTAHGLLRWDCRRRDLWMLWRQPKSLSDIAHRAAQAAKEPE